MNNPIVPALIGALVGGTVGFLSSYYLWYKTQKAQTRAKQAERLFEAVRLLQVLCQDYEALVRAKHTNNEDEVRKLPPSCWPAFRAMSLLHFFHLEECSEELIKKFTDLKNTPAGDVWRNLNKESQIAAFNLLATAYQKRLREEANQ